MLFGDHFLGEYLSIDEVSLSKGELYTFITAKGGPKDKTLVASVKGTLSGDIVTVLSKLPLPERKKVKEITLDMANNMTSAAREAFPEAQLVIDRFHVIKLAQEALQHLRVKYRWAELDKENEAILEAKKEGKRYKAVMLSNGDTAKQLLARSRYVIARRPEQWTESQRQRAELLFKLYPDIEKAYKHSLTLRNFYEYRDKKQAQESLQKWIKATFDDKLETFYTTAKTLKAHFDNILNFFNHRHTNANAESFNARIKLFRANLRGVTDTAFFLFRLHKFFARSP